MHCHGDSSEPQVPTSDSVILVGNPNVGKSVIFSYLTGRYVEVSNYPGTTVEVTRGKMGANGATTLLIDTPGINSLIPRSGDEKVTRDILIKENPRAVIQIADVKNLRRALLLTTQLAEMGTPMVLVLNMQDEALARAITVDADELSQRLGVEIIPATAVTGEGLDSLPEAIGRAHASRVGVSYDETVSAALSQLEALLPAAAPGKRGLAIMALAADDIPAAFPEETHQQVTAIRQQTAGHYSTPLLYTLNQQRLQCVDAIVSAVYHKKASAGTSLPERLSRIATHPIWGWPVLAAVLFGVYQFVGVFGAGTLVGLLDNTLFAAWINPWVTGLVTTYIPIQVIQDFLVGEYGLVTMALSYGIAIVLPIVATFFLAFSLLEDSGYLPRLAVMVNRPFKAMGLNGKAVLPMVLGLGCDTMATMTTRILETRKERVIVTLLLALAVPCSAQIAVILGMIGYVSPAAMAIWAVVVVAVLLAVGWLAAKVLPGRGSDFMLELPPLRVPQAGNIAVKTLARIEWYLREALPLFVLGTLILWTLDRFGGLAVLERVMSPVVVGLLGLPREAAAAFILGFLRRDYAAAGLFQRYQPFMEAGTLTRSMEIEVTVALVTVTLFIPCIANFFMIVKERGWKTGAGMAAFILPFSIGVGALLNVLMRQFY